MERSQQAELFPFFLSSLFPLWTMVQPWGSPLFSPTPIPWLRQHRKKGSNKRKASAEGMNKWSHMAQESSLPKLPLFQYIRLLQDMHCHSETFFVSVQEATEIATLCDVRSRCCSLLPGGTSGLDLDLPVIRQ